MPIYEQDLSHEDMEKATDSFVCAVCKGTLTVAWSGNCYMLRCGTDLKHEGIVPKGRDPALLEINAKLRGGDLPMETKELAKLDQNQMLTRIDKARFPADLRKEEKALMATIAIEYGLDPLFGELMIYQGKPYVTIDARRRKAQETNKLAGINSRAATQKERKERGVANGDYLFVCQVWVKDIEHPFEGWGKVRAAEVKGSEHLPIVKDPAAMAEKRAEAQALRRAFHIPLPSAEEIIDAEFTDVTPGQGTSTKPPTKTQGNNQKGRMATQAQINKIWADSSTMGYQKDEVHAITKKNWGVESLTGLSVAQASELIDMIARGEGLPTEPFPEE